MEGVWQAGEEEKRSHVTNNNGANANIRELSDKDFDMAEHR